MVSERRDCRERKCTTYRQERNVGQSEGWYQREGTVGRGSVRPIDKRGMLDRARDGIREKGLSGEEVYDLSTREECWTERGMVSERRDCRERKCTTYRQERNVGQSEGWYQREGTVGRGSVRPIDKRGMLDRARDGIREKGLSGEEVYDLSTREECWTE